MVNKDAGSDADKKTLQDAAEHIRRTIEPDFNENDLHGTIYARLAHIRNHYPPHYLAAALTHCSDERKFRKLAKQCDKLGIQALGPDINQSREGFTPVFMIRQGEDSTTTIPAIRTGLAFVPGVTPDMASQIVAERDTRGAFKSELNFRLRTDGLVSMFRVPEYAKALDNAGAFDSLRGKEL